MTKLIVRTTPQDPAPSCYINYQHRRSPFYYNDIRLPADEMVAMANRLMLRVQAGLRPLVTWERTDTECQHITMLRWSAANAQLQLEAHIDGFGIHLWLHDRFVWHGEPHNVAPLVYWHAARIRNTAGSQTDDYGTLWSFRLENLSGRQCRSVQLKFDDPVFDNVPRRRPSLGWSQPSAELGDDIIAVTHEHLQMAGIA